VTIDLFIDRLDVLGKNLPAYVMKIAERESEAVTASIIRRLETTGTDARGHKFGGTAIRLDPAGIYSTWHAETRKDKGRQVDFMDFSFTDQMLASVQEISAKTSGDIVEVVTGASGDRNREVMKGNVDREGELLEANEEEIAKLENNFRVSLEEQIKVMLV